MDAITTIPTTPLAASALLPAAATITVTLSPPEAGPSTTDTTNPADPSGKAGPNKMSGDSGSPARTLVLCFDGTANQYDGDVSRNMTDTVLRTNAPWGLSRLSQDATLTNQDPTALNFTYRFDSSAGANVDVYIVGMPSS